MMIYSHIWESHYFLKLLVRIAHFLDGKDYDWNLDVSQKNHSLIIDNVIDPLISKNIALGNFVEECYQSDIRNAFAHAQYTIDRENKTIMMFQKSLHGNSRITYKQFQEKFLKSICLCYFLTNTIEKLRFAAGEYRLQSGAILMPNGHYTQIKATLKI